MKDRTEPMRAVDLPSYIHVDLPTKGRHDFRLPSWSQASRIATAWTGRPEGDGMWEYVSLLIGASWRHESLELEAVFPDADPTAANLVRYSVEVQRELEDAGYTAHEVRRCGTAVLDALRDRMKEREEASEAADFSSPPPATPSSP